MALSKIFIAAVGLLAMTASCKDREEKKEVNIGGKGGSTTLEATPKHHSKNIDSCTIYIKYNTKELPTTFDDSAKCVLRNGVPVATFTGLKKGDYYLYGKGWDPSIVENVKGGIPYTINDDNKTIPVTVPVTEDHQ